jgi:ketosteroid isomerase-like protein
MRYLLGFCLSCVLSAGLPQISAAAANNGDRAAVTDVFNYFVDAWNRHDMKALASVFSEDADFVNVIRQRWIGRKAIKTPMPPITKPFLKRAN